MKTHCNVKQVFLLNNHVASTNLNDRDDLYQFTHTKPFSITHVLCSEFSGAVVLYVYIAIHVCLG